MRPVRISPLEAALLSALLSACSPVPPVESATGSMLVFEEETNGFVTMDADRRLFIYYDDRPGTPVGSFPGEPNYRLSLELAGDIQPGQRRRLARAIAMYAREPDGSYSIFEYMHAEGTVPEPGVRTVSRNSREYQCYRGILGADLGPGQHYLRVSDWRRIAGCVRALP